jgi:hypothetical protein
MNKIESKLRADGAAWRRDVQAIDAPSELTSPKKSRAKQWMTPIAAAVVFVTVALVSVMIADRGQTHGPHQGAGGATSSPTTSLPSGALSGSVDPLSPTPAPTRADPLRRFTSAGAVGMTSVPWRFAGVSADGRVVTLTWVTGGCVRVGYEVDETTTDVRVQVVIAPASLPSGMICASDLIAGAGTITLSQPLGDRQLLHGPVG